MKTILLLLFVSFFVSHSKASETTVYFEKGSYKLTNAALVILDSLAIELKKSSNYSDIELIGFTDVDASYNYNQRLSSNRCHEVRKYFNSKGIFNRFHIVCKGEKEATEFENESDKANDRKVLIRLDYSSKNSIHENSRADSQVFKLNPYSSDTIQTESGLVLRFPKDIFKDVQPHLPITIKIEEYFRKSEFLLANLSTKTTSDDLLESKGMIHIEVSQKGRLLELKPGKTFGVYFPKRKDNDATLLFDGIESNDSEIKWERQTGSSTISSSVRTWYYRYYAFKDKPADTIEKGRTWYENINGVPSEITHKIYFKENREVYDTVSVASRVLVDDLIQESSSLGWINCDRFLNLEVEKGDLIVEVNDGFVPSLNLVFDNYNSILPYSYREGDKYYFLNVPKNEPIHLVGLFKGEFSENVKFSYFPTSTNKQHHYAHFREMELSEVKSKLKLLDI